MASVRRAIGARRPARPPTASACRAAVAAALVALVLATLSAALIGGKIYTSGDNILLWPPFSVEAPHGWVRPSNAILTDPVVGFNPDLLLTRADLHAGILPLWNPYAAGGRPLLASQVHAPLFPTTWLAFLLPFWTSLGWIAAAKLLLASSGVYLFCRELRLRRGPALLGAITFAFGSYYFVWLEHPQTNVWAMLPWMFLGTRRVCTRGGLGAAALLGLATGMSWLGGHPESGAFLLGATVAYGAFELIADRLGGPTRASRDEPWLGPKWTEPIAGRAGLLLAALLLGLGISTIVNLPLLELLHQSGKTERGGPGATFRMAWSFFFPQLWGSPAKVYNGLGPYNYNERTAYIGALPLLLAVGAIGRHRPREQWFFVGLALVLLATVFNTPVWANAVRSLPGGNVAALGRLLIIVSFSGAVLAAYGLQRWLAGSAQERRQMLWIMGLVAIIPPLLWVPRHLGTLSSLPSALGQLPAVHYAESSPTVVALASVWRWVLICALGIGGLALARRKGSPALAVALLIVLTGVDLVSLDRGYHGTIPLAEANPPVPPAIRYLQTHEGDGRIMGSGIALPANLAERYGLRDPRVAIDIPYPSRYDLLWTFLGGIGGDQEFYSVTAPYAQLLADIFATRYVLLPPGEAVPAWLKPVFSTPDGTVAFNPTALPRAWVAYQWRPVRAEINDWGATVTSTTSQLLHQPVIEGAPASPEKAAPPPTPATIAADGPESVTIDATARRPGYLILDDSAYPGWHASLDGHPVRWIPANENFRAVPIPAGRHVIRFTYRPASVLAGAILSALSLLAVLVLAAFGFWSLRRSSNSNAGGSSNGHRARPALWARKRARTSNVLNP